MDIIYLGIGALLALGIYGLALGCARLQRVGSAS